MIKERLTDEYAATVTTSCEKSQVRHHDTDVERFMILATGASVRYVWEDRSAKKMKYNGVGRIEIGYPNPEKVSCDVARAIAERLNYKRSLGNMTKSDGEKIVKDSLENLGLRPKPIWAPTIPPSTQKIIVTMIHKIAGKVGVTMTDEFRELWEHIK